MSGPSAKLPALYPAAQPALAVAVMTAAAPASVPAPRPVSAFEFGRLQDFNATVDPNDATKLILPSGEIHIFSTGPVDVTDGTEKKGCGGRLVLTSKRVLWSNGATKLAWPLDSLCEPQLEAPSLFSLFHSPHVFITVLNTVCHSAKAPSVKLSFKGGGSDAANAACVFSNSLTSARSSCLCAAAAVVRDATAMAEPTLSVDGIAGLRKRDEKARSEALQLARSPIVHLEDLRARIGPLMKYVAEASAEVKAARERSGVSETEDEGLTSLLADVGAIGTPITRALAGRNFIDSLAREVASVMRKDLEVNGGLLPLSEVYCAYNRKRGHDIVSPDDLLAAVARMPALGLGMSIREIKLDARARSLLALDQLDDGRLVESLRALVERAGSVSAIDVAAEMRVSVAVATAHLRLAEARAAVVRDESAEGVRFYLNQFMQSGARCEAAST